MNDVESAVSPFYQNWNTGVFAGYLKKFGLDTKKKVKELSRGMKVKLQIATALSHNAKLLILDEPTSGLDPAARDEICDLLREFVTDENKSVFFSTHITTDLEKTADHITFILNGTVVFTGTKDALIEKYARVTGGLHDMNGEQKKFIIGYREHSTGFEGMVETENIRRLPNSVLNFAPKNLLIFAALAIFLSVISGSVQTSIGIGFMLGTLFVSYPFAVGEKCNLDALYVTLSVNKGTVVRGRYLFVLVLVLVLVLNLLTVLGSFICASFGLFAARTFGVFQSETGGNDPFALILVMSALMILIQVIQLSIFFKTGYTKAKFLRIVTFVALFGGFSAFMSVSGNTPNELAGLWDFLANTAKNGMAVPLAVLVLVLAICVSYCLSLSAYKKREF